MKLLDVYRSPILHGYVIEVENLAEFPVLLRVQEIELNSGAVILRYDSGGEGRESNPPGTLRPPDWF